MEGRAREAAITLVCAAALGIMVGKVGDASTVFKLTLIAVGLVLVTAAALNPVFGAALVFAAVPFDLKLYVGDTPVGTNNLIVFATALVLVWRIRFRDVPLWIRGGSLLLIAGSVASIFVAYDRWFAFFGAMRWVAVLALLAAVCTRVRDVRSGERAITILACTAVIETFFVLLQRKGINVLTGPSYFADKVDGFFGYYTQLGGFFAIAAILLTAEALEMLQRRRNDRAAAMGAALVFVLLGVAVTLSRGGLLATGTGLAVLAVLSAGRGTLLVRVASLVGIVAVVSFAATPPETRVEFSQRFQQPLGSTNSDQARFALQAAGKRAAAANPLGLGYGNFSGYLARTSPSSLIRRAIFHAHNTWIEMALDSGYVGVVGFGILLLTPFLLALRRLTRPGVVSARGLGAVAAIAGFLAQGMYDYLFYEISFLVIVAALTWLAWFELAGPGSAATPTG